MIEPWLTKPELSGETRSWATADASVENSESVAGCWLARFTTTPCRFRADGQPDRAHLIPAQRLRQAGRPDQDERLVVPACRFHHDALDVTKTIRLAFTDYPPELHDYAKEHGFYWAGERDGWRAEHLPQPPKRR